MVRTLLFNKTNFNQLFMKQKLFGAAALVAFILAGASCSKQEQSEFNLNSVKQEVTISATVTYSTGVDVNATSYSIINSKPAAGRKVFVEVPYAQYSAGVAAADGNKIFETVTDENGKFSITIPTKSTGVNAIIRMEEFTDIYRTYEKMGADGKPVFKTELRNYHFDVAANGLKPGAFKFPEEIVYFSDKIDVDQFSNEVTMTGKVNLAYETAYRKGAFKAADKATVEFTIVYDAGTPNELELKFGTTTDAQGNYTITLPVKSLADGFSIKGLKVLGIGDNQFVHYDTDSTTVNIYGAYELQNFGNIPVGGSLAFGDIIDGVTYNLGAQNLLFTPYYNANVTDTADPDNWDENLIGWAAGMAGFDESYSKTVTLTGKIYMPYLKSFGEAAYRNEVQTIVLTGAAPYDNGLTVITDANGNFSVDIPVCDDNPLAFNVELAQDVQPFEFIDSKSRKTVLRDGAYDDNKQIKAEGSEWYELGDFYFIYTPDGGEQPAEWNKYLIGWYKDAQFNKPVEVKGSILFAVETEYGIGTYVPQTRIVTVYDATNDRTFAIKTKANGSYDFEIPLEDENDQPAIAITSDEYYTNEYEHFPKYNSTETKLLAGTYSVYTTSYNTKDESEAWNNLGTQYMYIASGDLDHATSTYNDNLAGWFIKTDGNDVLYQQSVKASGKALKAEETGFLTGEYKPAKGMLVKITVYGEDIAALANNSGIFSFNVPLKNTGDETALNVAADDIDIDNFKHYADASGKTKTLEGTYSGVSVKEDEATWNDLGTVYYKFTPTTPFDMWTDYAQYIAGWVYKKGYNVRTAVNGSVKIAQETGFWTGNYVEGKNIPVKIEVNTSEIYVAPTDNEGNYSIEILQQFADDEPAINWHSIDLNPEEIGMEFTHYRNPGSDATMKLEGKYTEKSTVNPSTKWTEQGTRYYSFAADGTPKNWTTQLCGWAVWGSDEKNTISVIGAVKKAVEKLDGTDPVEAWDNAGYVYVTAKVKIGTATHTFKVATSSNGQFRLNQIKVKEIPDDIKLTITVSDFDDNAFKHWTDKGDKNSNVTISGTYSSEDNIYEQTINKDGSTFDLTKGTPSSAKMTFTPSGATEGWASYSWASMIND